MNLLSKILIGTGAALASLTGASMIYNTVSKPRDLRPPTDFAPEDSFVTLDGYRTHYQRAIPGDAAGQRTPIILIHGFNLWLYSWRDNLPVLGEFYPTYAYDRLGFGLSDKPKITYDLDLFSRQLVAFLDHFGIERAVLVGHSAGGPVAIRTAVAAPQRVAGLVLAAPVGLETPPPDLPVKIAARTPFVTSAVRLLQSRQVLSKGLLGMAYHDRERLTDEVLHNYELPLQTEGSDHTVVGLLRGGNPNSGIPADLPQIACPTLVLAGESDRIVKPENAREMARLIPGARFKLIPQAGHLLMEERTEAFNDEVLSFMRDVVKG